MRSAFVSCPQYNPRLDTPTHLGRCPITGDRETRYQYGTVSRVLYHSFDHPNADSARTYMQTHYHCLNHPEQLLTVHFRRAPYHARTDDLHHQVWQVSYANHAQVWTLRRPPVITLHTTWAQT